MAGRDYWEQVKTILDVGKPGVKFCVDLRCAATALIKRLEDDVGHCKIGRIDLLQRAETRQGGYHFDTIHTVRHVDHPACHRVGTGVRSTFGQLGPGEKIEFVLRWNESSRHFVEQQCGRGQQNRIYGEHDSPVTECAPHRTVIVLRTSFKEAIKRMKQPAERAFDAARQHIFGRIVPSE